MGLFKKKHKLTEEEREAKYDQAENRFIKNIKQLEDYKKQQFAILMQCRAKSLPENERQARASLARIIAQIRMQESALMSLRQTRLDREFAGATKDFFDCVIMISEDIMQSTKGVDLKKVEKAMDMNQFNMEKTERNLDQMLEVGNTNNVNALESGRYAQYDAEIDSMIAANEGGSSVGGVNMYDKQKY